MANEVAWHLALLPDDVINKIAAGEVVERPASIVRELVDNAIDAGASSVVVEVCDGGQTLVKVSDDGSGMSADDAILCFKRHATSKIKNVSDLESISTLGFRGEALSSISSVADVRLRTKQSDSDIGTEVCLKEGKIISTNACTIGVGSDFEVSKLFMNLPARRKFLKSPRSDLSRIQEWLYQSAIAHPNVRYKFISDGKEIFRLGEHKSIFERLETLLLGSTIRIDFQAGPFKVKGIIAHHSQAEYKVGGFVFLVNGRPIQDRMLMKALRDAWSTGIRSAENPVGALEITLPCSEVDINVHPQKSEVRFRNSQAVFASLYRAVKSGLSEWRPVSEVDSILGSLSPLVENSEASIGIDNSTSYNANATKSSYSTSFVSDPKEQYRMDTSKQIFLHHNLNNENSFNADRYIGQILGVFLIYESAGKTFLVDAHAAHERIRFNQLLSWANSKTTATQKLLLSEKIELPSKQIATLVEKQSQLQEYGIYFKADDSYIYITEVPSIINFAELRPLLVSLAEIEVVDVGAGLQKVIEKNLARAACRSSVMSGVRLNASEAEVLWNQIRCEPHGAVCPHGRPVMVELSRSEVDKMFCRDGF